jgi:hypothetical protein
MRLFRVSATKTLPDPSGLQLVVMSLLAGVSPFLWLPRITEGVSVQRGCERFSGPRQFACSAASVPIIPHRSRR